MRKAVIYARVSTKEQEKEGYSIPAQLKACRRLAFKRRLEVVAEFVEAESAKTSGRKEFGRMVEYLAKNPQIKIVIAHKLDRLSRNFKDEVVLGELGVETLFVEDKFDNTANGRLLRDIKLVLAKNYIENLREEIKKGLREKAAQGNYPFYAPLGYLNDKEGKRIVVDKKRCFYIRRAFELYASGEFSVKEIARLLYEEGLRSKKGTRVRTSTIHEILKNPFYLGYFRYKGSIYKGNHKAIVSKALFDKVQERLSEKGRAKRRKHKFALRGFLLCGECGCRITAEIQKGHIYYRCSKSKGACSQPYIREEDLEREIDKILSKIEIDRELFEIMLSAIREDKDRELERQKKTVASLQVQLKKVIRRQSRLVDAYLDGDIPIEIYRDKNKKLTEERIALEGKIEELQKEPGVIFEQVKSVIETAHVARKVFSKGSFEEKRRLLHLVSSNLVLKDRRICSYQLKEPFSFLIKEPNEDRFAMMWA